MKSRRSLFILFIILVLAAFLRFYKVESLAVFLSDQASDSTKVLEMTHGHLTLLGPITSVGGFFNGPIVYYLMLPFYWILKGQPVAGTVFQTVLQIATIPFIFLVGKKLKNETVGFLAAFFFAVSPLMVDYSRAAFNSYPAVFFSTLIIYLFLKITDRQSIWLTLIMGVAIGFIIQMHYFCITFVIVTFLYPFLFEKKLLSLNYFLTLFFGVVFGFSPFIVFELRHSFLNTHLFLKYLTSQTKSTKSIFFNLYIWPKTTGLLLFGGNFIFGLLGFLGIIATTIAFYLRKQIKKDCFFLFAFLFTVVFCVGQIYGGLMQHHYIVSFHTSLIILFALVIYSLLRKNLLLISIFCFLIFLINLPHWNLEKARHPLQQGMAIADFKKAAKIIQQDKKGVYNVAMHTQGDNRAMPLRYLLLLVREHPLNYEHYGEAETLYFIIPKNEKIKDQTMWEYTSFGSSNIVNKWEINDQYFLYKITKL